MRLSLFIAAAILALAPSPSNAQTLFFDDFQDGDAKGWTAGGKGDVQLTNYQGNYSLRLTKRAFAAIGLRVSGPEEVAISVSFAAAELEKKDACLAEASSDGGESWQVLHQIGDGMDDGVSLHVGGGTIAAPKDAPLFVRLRADANGNNDTCWADNVVIRAVMPKNVQLPLGPRTHLPADFLNSAQPFAAPVPMAAFDKAIGAERAAHGFEGTLTFTPSKDGSSFSASRDRFNFMVNPLEGVTRPPAFELSFVQFEDRIIPTERGLIRTDNLAWDIIVDVGRVWREPRDGSFSRAAIPFALQERNANCTHNGVLTFVYNDTGVISRAAYQISAETCAYFQYDMWGLAAARFEPGLVDSAEIIKSAYAAEVAARLAKKPMSALSADYPALPLDAFAAPSDISPEHLTMFGLVLEGTHYRAGCQTRQGPYPFCEEMALPSYSTSKSTFAGLALMRLEFLYPGASSALISNYVPQCSAGWDGVTFGNALDMATGRYDKTDGESDENAALRDGFFTVPGHSEKIERACGLYPRKETPGKRWVYHTSDHYVLGAAMQAYLRSQMGQQADIYDDLLVKPIWSAIGLSPVANKTRRTRDDMNQPYVGWGLTYLADDLAKLARFFSIQQGRVDGTALIDTDQLAAALQQRSNDPGLPAPGKAFRYNNGVWAWNAGPTLNCATPLWVPFMSGFGGLSVVMMPNGVIYYYVSDNYEFAWASAVKAANAYKPMCKATP